mgnify:CR=1 FL=1
MELAIRQERIKRGWSQSKVAKQVGLSQSMLLKIETGKRKPSFDVLVKLEDLFGMDYRELFNAPQRKLQDNTKSDGNQTEK